MKKTASTRRSCVMFLTMILSGAAASLLVAPPAFAQAEIAVNGFLSAEKAPRGQVVQAAIVMDIPGGYHVNGNKPLGKYAVPTALQIEASDGVKIGSVTYPRSTVRRFSFTPDQLAVYEGRAVMRFNITVPASFGGNATELRARLRYQSCTDEVCFPPATKEITLPVAVGDATEPIKRINTQFFSGSASGGSKSGGSKSGGTTTRRGRKS